MAALGALVSEMTKQIIHQLRLVGGVDVETIAADGTIDKGTSNFCRINGGTSSRNVDFESAVANWAGAIFWITNSGATNNLVVRDSVAATIATLRPGETVCIASSATAHSVISHGFDAPPVQSVSWQYGEGTQIDAPFWVAPIACRVVSIVNRPFVVGSDGGAVTMVVKKAASGTAIASGTALMSDTFNLKATIDTNVTGTLTATAADLDLAAGTALGIDYTGTLTAARGTLTVAYIPS